MARTPPRVVRTWFHPSLYAYLSRVAARSPTLPFGVLRSAPPRRPPRPPPRYLANPSTPPPLRHPHPYHYPAPTPDVAVQAPALGYGSSGYSTGFLRAYYSFDETMQLALDGIDAYKKVTCS